MDDAIYAYLHSLRESKRWNIDLRPLMTNGPDIAGIVLHDEFSALLRARHRLEALDFEMYETDSTKRFRGIIVDYRPDGAWKRVLLLETGMGSMNASLAIYELAAGLLDRPTSKRVIKIGTCSGLYPGVSRGSVLAPLYPLADEGATKWNDVPQGKTIEEWLKEQFYDACKLHAFPADFDLTNKWHGHLKTRWPDCLGAEGAPEWWASFPEKHQYQTGVKLDTAIWSIDNFHGVRSVAKHIYESIDEWVRSGHPNPVPVGFENECSSHYSACRRADLKIATGLVVSWSCDDVNSFVDNGKDPRDGTVKTGVHETESDLIIEAVKFLFA